MGLDLFPSPGSNSLRSFSPPSTRGGGKRVHRLACRSKEKWPLAGPFLCRASVVSVFVPTMLDDHHLVMMATPVVLPMFAEVPMFAELGTRAEMAMVAAFDHNGFSACNRRRCDGDRAKG